MEFADMFPDYITIQRPIPFRTDSISAIFVGENRVNNTRTRHIDFRYMRIRDEITDENVTLEHIAGIENPADLFTKPLARELFARFTAQLNMGIAFPEEEDNARAAADNSDV
jgi:hypothetical protein